MAGGRPKKPENWIWAGMEGDRRASALQFTQIFTQQQQQRWYQQLYVWFQQSSAFSRTGGGWARWINFKYATAAPASHTVRLPSTTYIPTGEPVVGSIFCPFFFYPPFLVVIARTHAYTHTYTQWILCASVVLPDVSCKLADVRSTQGLNFGRKEIPQGSASSSDSQYAKEPVGVTYSRVFLLLLLLFGGRRLAVDNLVLPSLFTWLYLMNGQLKHSPDPSQLLTFFFFCIFPGPWAPPAGYTWDRHKNVLLLINMEADAKHKVNTSMSTC